MYEDFYAKLSAPFRSSVIALKAVPAIDKLLTSIFYLSYPLLLVLLFVDGISSTKGLMGSNQLLVCVLSPTLGFTLVSWLRKSINAARPYEKYAIEALIQKDTRGQSFPSKHVYSSFAIAMCWLSYSFALGIVFLTIAALIALIRVVGGVHFPKDVLAGALIGSAFGGMASLL